MQRIKYVKYASIAAARRDLAGWVRIYHAHSLGGSPRDRRLWCAEYDYGDVDYGARNCLVAEALRQGKRVAILRQHRNGMVTAVLVKGIGDAGL